MFYLSVNWLRAYIFVIGLADESGMFCRRISGEVIWSRWCRGRCKRWSELMSVQKVRVLNMNSHYIFLLICERERERVNGCWFKPLLRGWDKLYVVDWLSPVSPWRRHQYYFPSVSYEYNFFFVKQEKKEYNCFIKI